MRCRRRLLVGLVLLLGFGVATSGCSVVFVDGPPPRPRRPDFDCSSTYGVPALDTGIALVGLALVAIKRSGPIDGLSSSGVPLLAFSSTFVFSAIDGYQQVYACREAVAEAAPPPAETPHHHRLPPPGPAPAGVMTPSAPPVPQEPDSSE